MAVTADPGDEDVIIDVLPGGAREDRLVIAEETEPRVDVDPELRIEIRVESSKARRGNRPYYPLIATFRTLQ